MRDEQAKKARHKKGNFKRIRIYFPLILYLSVILVLFHCSRKTLYSVSSFSPHKVKHRKYFKSGNRKCVLKFRSTQGRTVYIERQATSAVSRGRN